ncbi:MAG: serine/threonine protein kinase [Chloroflexota bacterium]|nr:serine/threonine protein kinase [Chloroflexota bacterium]
MPEDVAGFRYWEVIFGESGEIVEQAALQRLLSELPGQGLSDLFVFSHGWNNDHARARRLYADFFGEFRGLLDAPNLPVARQARPGLIGVIWPSMRWADEPPPTAARGGAAAAHPAAQAVSERQLVTELKSVFADPKRREALDELADLLDRRPREQAALERFHELMRVVASGPELATGVDGAEQAALLEDDPAIVFERFGRAAAPTRREGAASLQDQFTRLWNGAREALRQATYFEMKKRAGVVGQQGLGPLLGRLAETQQAVRLHLLGHSFGARLVSFSLAGLAVDRGSPVKSLTLLQGAFSHFAFADALPHDPGRAGALAGMPARVDGPILVTHTRWDTALSRWYPRASFVGRQDAAANDPVFDRWGAMGGDGAQAVNAASEQLGGVGQPYPFAPGKFINLDGNALMKRGEPPSGAHGDIIYPQIAWAVLSAAGITGRQ